MVRRRFPVLVFFALSLAVVGAIHAQGPALEWGPVDSVWKSRKILTGSAAVPPVDGNALEDMADNAPRSGSFSLDKPFYLAMRYWENEKAMRGTDVSVALQQEPFKSCAEGGGAYPGQEPRFFEYSCRDTSFRGLRAVRIRTKDLGTAARHSEGTVFVGDVIKVEIGPGKVLGIYLIGATTRDGVARAQKRFEDFLSTLRIKGKAPAPKRQYHAKIHIRKDYHPGGYLGPTVTVLDQDGNVCNKDVAAVVFWLNGREGENGPWDGSRTTLKMDISMKDGQSFEVTGVIPAWKGPAAAPTLGPALTPTPRTLPPVKNIPGIVPIDEDAAEGGSKSSAGEPVPGLSGAGRLPGPGSVLRALAGILGPAIIAAGAGLLAGLGGSGSPPPAPTPQGAPHPPAEPPTKKPRSTKKKKRAAPPPAPPPPKPPGPTAEEKKREAEKARKKAEKAREERRKRKEKEGYFGGLLRRAKGALKATVEAAKDVGRAAKDVYKNPSLITATAKNAWQEAKDTAAKGVDLAKKLGAAGADKAKAIWKDTKDVVTHPRRTLGEIRDVAKDVYKHPKILLDTVKGTARDIRDLKDKADKAQLAIVKHVLKTLHEAATDPDKAVDLLKTLTGIEDLEKSIESDRSLPDRLAHSVLGLAGLFGAAEAAKATAQGVRAGGSAVLKAAGRESASLADDAARLAAKAEGKTAGAVLRGEADDAARSVSAAGKAEDVASQAGRLEEAAAPVAPAKEASVFVEAPDVVPDVSGYTKGSQGYLKDFAESNNVELYTRPTTPRAARMIEQGEAVPKPMFVKNKTINSIDAEFLGASEGNIGKVGSFEPRRPTFDDLKDLPLQDQKNVLSRYHQRLQEYKDQAEHLIANSDRCYVDQGVIYDRFTGKPYTGDIDVYAIRGRNGKVLPPEQVAAYEAELARNGVESSVMHGAHENWDMTHLTGEDLRIAQGIDGKIRGSHGIGGEALVSFKPGASGPSAAYVDNSIQLGMRP